MCQKGQRRERGGGTIEIVVVMPGYKLRIVMEQIDVGYTIIIRF